MTDMFTQAANFNSMLDSTEPLHVSEVVHKAFIEITEDGAEAAAATGKYLMQYIPFNHSMCFVFVQHFIHFISLELIYNPLFFFWVAHIITRFHSLHIFAFESTALQIILLGTDKTNAHSWIGAQKAVDNGAIFASGPSIPLFYLLTINGYAHILWISQDISR